MNNALAFRTFYLVSGFRLVEVAPEDVKAGDMTVYLSPTVSGVHVDVKSWKECKNGELTADDSCFGRAEYETFGPKKGTLTQRMTVSSTQRSLDDSRRYAMMQDILASMLEDREVLELAKKEFEAMTR